jgi:hypothetical protein
MTTSINFHIHTTHSDGENTTAEVVSSLKEKGVTTFAITDHDCVDGNIEAAILAKKFNMAHINGIEFSCCFSDCEIGLDESWTIHILGLGFNLGKMKSKLEVIESEKQECLLNLVKQLVNDGYQIDLEDVTHNNIIPDRNIISKVLINKGYAKNGNDCYDNILNTEKYRHFAKHRLSIKEGIKTIRECNGIAVWAHPFEVLRGGKKGLTQKQVFELLKDMINYGIKGLEVYYQNYSPEQIARLKHLADVNNLFKSVGTDYHYPFESLVFDRVEPDDTDLFLDRLLTTNK